MSKSLDIPIRSKQIRLTVSHCYRLSEGKYLHMPILVISGGINGIGVHVIGLYFGFSINNR